MFLKYEVYVSLLLVFFLSGSETAYALNVTISARVPGCGDNILDVNEQCDGNPVLHNSCSNMGFQAGNLSCTNACNYDTSSCSVAPSSVSPGGSFSIIDYIKNNTTLSSIDIKKLNLADNSVIFEGVTKPDTEVFLSDDTKIIRKTKSDKYGKYSLSVSNLSKKDNIFTLTSGNERKRFIVNMYSNNIVKYNDVALGSQNKFKIDAIIKEYEDKMNVDFTDFQSKITL